MPGFSPPIPRDILRKMERARAAERRDRRAEIALGVMQITPKLIRYFGGDLRRIVSACYEIADAMDDNDLVVSVPAPKRTEGTEK